MIDTNVKGLLYVTRAFSPTWWPPTAATSSNIGSTAGHLVYPRGNVYNATRFAVNALSHATSGTGVRVSTVDPGLVENRLQQSRFRGDAAKNYRGITPLVPADVAEAVQWVVDRPPRVNVRDVVLMPTAQRNAYVVHKEES